MQHVKTRDIEGEIDRPPANGPAAWMDEVRATLALAWPLILTNLAQTRHDHDRRRDDGPARCRRRWPRALGYEPPLRLPDLRHRVVTAASPMIAASSAASGIRCARCAARCARGCGQRWRSPCRSGSSLARARPSCSGSGRSRVSPAQAGAYLRTLQWAMLPFLGYLVLRSFIAAMERPRWALLVVIVARSSSTPSRLGADVRPFRLAARSGCRVPGSPPRCLLLDVRRARGGDAAGPPLSRATTCSAASGGRTGRASASSGGSACPSARRSPSR